MLRRPFLNKQIQYCKSNEEIPKYKSNRIEIYIHVHLLFGSFLFICSDRFPYSVRIDFRLFGLISICSEFGSVRIDFHFLGSISRKMYVNVYVRFPYGTIHTGPHLQNLSC